ncbi:hypothetical protein [Cryptosporangium phraense]|uniref:Uncharacterized protein n=1 Tax=Cryptosporangium phraense TaxID=2593070 RepID=A0A545ALX8_9ACTN|nr:hypothetical protein [Cryptosporangium phraense]TQS42322.1 hypothetical protein FL583_25710 [Cryptosporangium phraense]
MRLYRRANAAGWSTVVLSATAGLAVAALVALTPWRVPDLPGARDRVQSVRENQTVERGEEVRSFFTVFRVDQGAGWSALLR